MKKPSSAVDVTSSQLADQTRNKAQNQVPDSEHQHSKTTKESRLTTNENLLSTIDITILKNYSQFFVELS